MSLNHVEIDYILNELNLNGAFIQNCIQSTYDTIALFTYKGESSLEGTKTKTIFICLAPGVCRIHETKRAIPKPEKPLRFMEFLRSRIKGARIQKVVQCGQDRIIQFTLSRAGQTLYMYVRLWSGASNIIVTDESGIILDAFYRRPKRNEIPGEKWAFFAPKGDQIPIPRSDPTIKIGSHYQDQIPIPRSDPTIKIGSHYQDQIPIPRSDPTFSTFQGISEKKYTLRDLPGNASFNQKIDDWYASYGESLSLEALLEQASRFYNTRIHRLEQALESLQKKHSEFSQAHLWKKQGDLLSSNMWQIKSGATSIELEDYERNNARITITLNPNLKPHENVELYYTNYKKAVSGLSQVEEDIATHKERIKKLRQQYELIQKEQNPLVIQQLLKKQSTPQQQKHKKYPGLAFYKEDWLFLVGRTAKENDELLRRHVRGLDTWLHVRDFPGSYVFIKQKKGKTIPLEILLDAGNLALYYSKARKAGRADLYYTQVKHLRRAKHGPKGKVLPTQEKNIHIQLDESKIKILLASKDDL